MSRAPAQTYQDQLPRLKDNVENAHTYFKPNYDRFHDFRRFVCDTSISDNEKNLLAQLQKPAIECNVQEAFVSRLRGEFAKQQPSITVGSADGQEVDPQLINSLEGHLRWLIHEANNDGFEYRVYTDSLTGGFGSMKLWTEYESAHSFEQVIRFGTQYDATLVGYDPLARKPHKGDGRYSFELFPKTKEEVEEEYDLDLSDIKFTRNIEGFNWSYENNNEKILLLCDYKEKKKKRTKIVKLSDGQSMTEDEYEAFIKEWNENILKGLQIKQPPVIVKSRYTLVETICRYVFIENKVLSYEETDYPGLPDIFVDGNSVYLKTGGDGASKQMTRPYPYHTKGVQKLKNFAMQTLANELENMVQQKWLFPKQGIVAEYAEALSNPQAAQVLVYNAYKNDDPNVPVPPPREVQRTPIPPEISNTFAMADQSMQMVLGSFDAALGINDNQLSGVAILEGATQSNAAAMPYVVGFLQGLNQLAQLAVAMIPKYYKTRRTLPVMDAQGKRAFVKVNQQGGVSLEYNPESLHVKVEAGVNFAIQKARALQQIVALMQASPLFAQFMNQEGLEILLDNLEIRGVDQLKEMSKQFMAKVQKQQAMAAQQPNPAMLTAQVKQQELAFKQQESQQDFQLRSAQIINDANANDTARLQVLLDAHNHGNKNVVEAAKAEAEDKRSAVDLALQAADMHHSHNHEKAELAHDVLVSQQQAEHQADQLEASQQQGVNQNA